MDDHKGLPFIFNANIPANATATLVAPDDLGFRDFTAVSPGTTGRVKLGLGINPNADNTAWIGTSPQEFHMPDVCPHTLTLVSNTTAATAVSVVVWRYGTNVDDNAFRPAYASASMHQQISQKVPLDSDVSRETIEIDVPRETIEIDVPRETLEKE